MKRNVLLFTVLACTISATFAGGGQSTPRVFYPPQTDSKIKVASLKTLQQRWHNKNISSTTKLPPLDLGILITFSNEEFKDANAILATYDSYVQNLKYYKDKCHYEPDFCFGESKWLTTPRYKKAHESEYLNDSFCVDEAQADAMKPLILELILKEDHPNLYAQLVQKEKDE